MANCSTAETNPSFTTPESLKAICNGGILNNVSSSIQRDANGMIQNGDINTIFNKLKVDKIVPIPSTDVTKTETYIAALNVFVANSKLEYTFYEVRYKEALKKLLSAVRDANNNPSSEKKATIDLYLGITQELNKKLNDLTQIIIAVSASLLTSSSEMDAQLANFNTTIQENRRKLAKQNQIISSSGATTKLQKEMVKYSEEKARYTDNLLKMYSFLNVVALGLLVYVYRASSSE